MPFQKGHLLSQGQNNPFYGRKHTEESKKKMSETIKKQFQEGKRKLYSPWLGKKISLETRKKMSLAQIKRCLEGKHNWWQGGKDKLPYPLEWTLSIKRQIRERDNYICQFCGQYGNEIHHLDYNKENCNENNLITLCHSCHSKTTYGNREMWFFYYFLKQHCDLNMKQYL